MSNNKKSSQKEKRGSRGESSSSSMQPWMPQASQWSPMPASHPWMWMPQPQVPGGPAPPSSAAGSARKPWAEPDEGESSSSSCSEDDFVPSKKRKQPTLKKGKSPASKEAPSSSQRRGPGRPSNAELERRRTATTVNVDQELPPPFDDMDTIGTLQRTDCKHCQIYEGHVLLKPCGHAAYCYKCVNSLRARGARQNRYPNCFNDECFDLVKGWLVLYNVSG